MCANVRDASDSQSQDVGANGFSVSLPWLFTNFTPPAPYLSLSLSLIMYFLW